MSSNGHFGRPAIVPWAVAVATAGLFSSNAPAQVAYSIRDLGILPGGVPTQGNAVRATGVNNFGQAAGFSSASSTTFRGFRTQPGGSISDPGADLGTFGGANSQARAINASGLVTGTASLSGGGSHAFRTTAVGGIPGATDLGTFDGGGSSDGYGINSSGQVAGGSTRSVGPIHAFRTSATGLVSDSGTDLGVFPGGTASIGQAINDLGQVAGYSEYAPPPPPGVVFGPVRAFRTTSTGLVSDSGADLGTLGGSESFGFGINNSGQVVGSSRTAFDLQVHAFRSSPNGAPLSLTDLGTLAGSTSIAYGINSFGIVVGESTFVAGFDGRHAFLFDTIMRDLNSLIPPGTGWELTTAFSISDNGFIAGIGRLGGLTRAFVLTPVPEPGTLLLVGAAVAGAWVWRRRSAKAR